MYFYLKTEDRNCIKELIKGKDDDGSTPLHWAAYSKAEDVLMYLINLNIFKDENEKQKFIDKQDNQGYTPLHLSVSSNSRRIVMKLLQSGANAEIIDKKNRTPLDLANSKGYREIVEILNNHKKCQICNFKAPVKQIKKSIKNIIVVFFFQAIALVILYFSVIPIALYSNIGGENYYFNIYCFFIFVGLLLFFFLIYITLLIMNPGEMTKNNEDTLKYLIEKEYEEDKEGEKEIDKNKKDKKEKDDLDLAKYCYKCFIEKTKDSKHCIVCEKCYEDFDHHCYWINKCVAKKNYYFFILFLFITFIYLTSLLILCIKGIINYYKNENNYCFNLFSFEINANKKIFSSIFGDYFHLILIILLLLINATFLLPETLLLFLHLNVCFNNLKAKKKKGRESSISMKLNLIDNSVGSDYNN